MFPTWLLPLAVCVFAALIVLYCLFLCTQLSALLREAAAAAEAEGERGGERGLTAEEVQRLEEGTMAVGGGGVCVVCRDEMEGAQAVRVLPGCRHAFHRSCADAWLQRQSSCPLCRARLLPPPLPLSTATPAPTPTPVSPSSRV
ncbi:E3 ubiquitin-protein ligase ATL23-like [Phoenix dactylifera]|uniref:E3 ubiquitin-protein ligase ATL23-like n=1 Tax=Phoenix dactylifera TaxID=42345 RepID=A0A8B7BYD3_PHODC|nr:E3 ubiquitin-protein ligase ATL23-like [Phoenix dactylifera]